MSAERFMVVGREIRQGAEVLHAAPPGAAVRLCGPGFRPSWKRRGIVAVVGLLEGGAYVVLMDGTTQTMGNS